jgi:hypothetical protein
MTVLLDTNVQLRLVQMTHPGKTGTFNIPCTNAGRPGFLRNSYNEWWAHEGIAMPKTQAAKRTHEAAIFARLWETGNGGPSLEVARHIVNLGFAEDDKRRMHELAVKNEQGRISPEELDELDSYIKVGDLLAILQSKARKRLKKSG